MKIPFDSLVLAAVVDELQPFVGGRVQRIIQPDPLEVVLALYSARTGEAALLLSCDPVFARAHLVTRRPSTLADPPAFLAALRARIGAATLTRVRQVGFDRILELSFESDEGRHRLIAELMGKHSNLILVESGERIVQAAKVIGPSKSVRVVVSGRPYVPPPFPKKPSLLEVGPEVPTEVEGLSPFLKKWLESGGSLAQIQRRDFHPVLVPGGGAYPVSVAHLGFEEQPRDSMSAALETHFQSAVLRQKTDQLRGSLIAGLKRVLLARETALQDLYQAREAEGRAARHQRLGELILAYGYGFLGQPVIQAYDYDGTEVEIPVDPELTPPENAEKLFTRAKKARARKDLVRDQIERLEADRDAVISLLHRVENAERFLQLETLHEEANAKRYLHRVVTSQNPEDRPFEGHRVRELQGPHGYRILYGENATANDFLTHRVARPDDWWLHVRGGVSTHVVIPTQRKPDRVPRETLLYAAKIAVQHSPSKHSSHVDVDYTLKKYVRKPRGAAPGSALYTHERTLTVD